MTDPLGKTVDETGDKLITTYYNLIILSCLPSLDISKTIQKLNFCKPRGPQHTYYYIVVIIVAGK